MSVELCEECGGEMYYIPGPGWECHWAKCPSNAFTGEVSKPATSEIESKKPPVASRWPAESVGGYREATTVPAILPGAALPDPTPPEPSGGGPLDLEAIEARLRVCSTGPWKACKASEVFDNWPICLSVGSDEDGTEWGVSTDRVHASEMLEGGAAEDAEFIAHARQDIPALIREVRRLRGSGGGA